MNNTNVEMEILSVVENSPMTRGEIAKAVKAEDNKVGNILQSLKKRGDMELTVGKKWRIKEGGVKRLNKKKEIKKEKSAPAKAELEKIAFQKFNKGIHPKNVIAELGNVDLVTELYKKWQKLNEEEYIKCINRLEKRGYIDTEGYDYTPGPVWCGISRLLNGVDKWKEKSKGLKRENTELHRELAECEKIEKLIDELAVKKWTPKEMADYLTRLYNVGAEINLSRDMRLVIYLKDTIEKAKSRGWTPDAFSCYVTLHANEIHELEKKAKELKKEVKELEQERDNFKELSHRLVDQKLEEKRVIIDQLDCEIEELRNERVKEILENFRICLTQDIKSQVSEPENQAKVSPNPVPS